VDTMQVLGAMNQLATVWKGLEEKSTGRRREVAHSRIYAPISVKINKNKKLRPSFPLF
jgi:hypothetical protein